MNYGTWLVVGTAAAALAAGAASAHHSAAMFDMHKTLTLEGTVKQWQFTAPHTWLIVTVKQADGKVVDWSFEGGGPSSGAFRKDTFKSGDKVKVLTHPMVDGRPAGLMGPVTLPDGSRVNDKNGIF